MRRMAIGLCGAVLALAVLGAAGPTAAGTRVRFQTVLGEFDVDLFDAAAPQTVANFLRYVDDRDYRRSFVHRSVPGFVIQGGGFTSEGGLLFFVPTDPPIPLELGSSNLRGTIAMARLAGEPDSATSQWFVNLVDNTFLDTSDGGFAVFGQVLAPGMAVVDAIAAVPIFDGSGIHAALASLPLRNYTPPDPLVPDENLIFTFRVLRVADGQCGDVNDDLVVDDLDPELLRAHTADPLGTPLTPAGATKCDTIGPAGACDLQDWVVLTRALAGSEPEIAPVCAAAAP